MREIKSDPLLHLSNAVYVNTSKHTHGGCTMNLQGICPTTGFVVGVYPECGKVFESYADFSNLDVLKFIKDNKAYLNFGNIYVGTWLNLRDGKIYMDVSKVVTSRKAALNMARLHSQSAYYDVENNKAIYV